MAQQLKWTYSNAIPQAFRWSSHSTTTTWEILFDLLFGEQVYIQMIVVTGYCTLTFILFHCRGFRAYLSSAPHYDFETYRKMVHNITEQFSNLSESIIEVETKLKENGRSNLADAIRKIQLKEKNKLELVSGIIFVL